MARTAQVKTYVTHQELLKFKKELLKEIKTIIKSKISKKSKS